jgi:hypothetical protein
MHLCRLDSEVSYVRLENEFVQNFCHFAFVRTNTEMIAHKPSHRMAPDWKKNPHMIPNRANEKSLRARLFCVLHCGNGRRFQTLGGKDKKTLRIMWHQVQIPSVDMNETWLRAVGKKRRSLLRSRGKMSIGYMGCWDRERQMNGYYQRQAAGKSISPPRQPTWVEPRTYSPPRARNAPCDAIPLYNVVPQQVFYDQRYVVRSSVPAF